GTEPLMTRPRILLADGHSDMRQYLTQVLSKRYEVIAAADASTTLTLSRQRDPDLVVADIMMRALRDFKLLCEVHKDAWLKVPIFLYSTPSDENSCVNVLEAESDGYINTPFSEDQLLTLIRAELRLSQTCRNASHFLRLSEKRFRTLKTIMPESVWIKAPNGELIGELASWWENLTGQTREQSTGLGYLDVVHPVDKPHVLKA